MAHTQDRQQGPAQSKTDVLPGLVIQRSTVIVLPTCVLLMCRFTGLASCSDCELFSEFVHDQQLLADCKSCCVKDAASVMYTKAVIEMCPFKRAGLPHVSSPVCCSVCSNLVAAARSAGQTGICHFVVMPE